MICCLNLKNKRQLVPSVQDGVSMGLSDSEEQSLPSWEQQSVGVCVCLRERQTETERQKEPERASHVLKEFPTCQGNG